MKFKSPAIITLVILSILSLIGTALLYPELPAQIATHFNASGVADSFNDKSFIFITGCLPLFLLLLFFIIPKIDPRKASYKKHGKVYTLIVFTTSIFLIFIHWTTIFIALGMNISIEKIVPMGVGILFIIIGNYLPRVRSNYTLGIRTPWALEDPTNWQKTQRIGGYMFILSGILTILGLFVSPEFSFILIVLSALLVIVVPGIVSYLDYRKKH